MVMRLGAAICGTAIVLACSSAAMARDEFDTSRHGVSAAATIVGAASMYNPYEPGYQEGGTRTATGERYDPSAWTAAIQTNLRGRFGGVRHSGRPNYALVESAGKKVIVKINDVGPLAPGRVIDFNKQTMHYFDPTLRRGVIHSVKVTPLPGNRWTPGPIAQR
jgi:rare lipoprotein A